MIKTFFQLESKSEKGKFIKLDIGTEGDIPNSNELFIVITKKDMDDRIICLTVNQVYQLIDNLTNWLQ